MMKMKHLWDSQGVGVCPGSRWKVGLDLRSETQELLRIRLRTKTREVTLGLKVWRPAINDLGGDRARKLG